MIELPLASSTWDDAEVDAIKNVISKNHYTMSDEVYAFEKKFADYFGTRFAIMVNSGSSANLLAIAAMTFKRDNPLKRGDEIIVPSLSWPTTFYPVSQYGMTLVFVDIDHHTLNINTALIENAITKKTKAIFVPNILGNPADLTTLKTICDQHGLYLIEDNCESLGATLNNKFAGTYGICGTFSCFFSHHISTMEGGIVVTNNEEIYYILLCLRAHGWTRQLPVNNPLCEKSIDIFYEQFRFILPGYNLRPLEMSGAIGNEQLKKLPSFLINRRKNAAHFVDLFKNDTHIIIQRENGKSSWFGFSFIIHEDATLNRSTILKKLAAHQIEMRPIISGNILRHPVIKYLDHKVIGKHENSDFVHDYGFFVGNHHVDIRRKLDFLKKLLNGVL